MVYKLLLEIIFTIKMSTANEHTLSSIIINVCIIISSGLILKGEFAGLWNVYAVAETASHCLDLCSLCPRIQEAHFPASPAAACGHGTEL